MIFGSVTHAPKIYVIHRKQDQERAAFIAKAYEDAKLTFAFFDATNGHGELREIAPFAHLIGDNFWSTADIKLGALACYISHYRAWLDLVESDAHYAVFAEDDSAPDMEFRSLWAAVQEQLEADDLIFINDRSASLASQKFTPAQMAVEDGILGGKMTHRAIGGDGYALTRKGAMAMIKFTESHKIKCGVDWALLGAAWNTLGVKHHNVKSHKELKLLLRDLGQRRNIIRGSIAHMPLLHIDQSFQSSIGHSSTQNISQLFEALDHIDH